jgi:hypothetical protein
MTDERWAEMKEMYSREFADGLGPAEVGELMREVEAIRAITTVLLATCKDALEEITGGEECECHNPDCAACKLIAAIAKAAIAKEPK